MHHVFNQYRSEWMSQANGLRLFNVHPVCDALSSHRPLTWILLQLA